MVHVEQMLWPVDPLLTIKRSNLNETELWVFKDRLYKNLCTVVKMPTLAKISHGGSYYTEFKDNADICYGVYTSGDPERDWCRIQEVRKLECGLKT